MWGHTTHQLNKPETEIKISILGVIKNVLRHLQVTDSLSGGVQSPNEPLKGILHFWGFFFFYLQILFCVFQTLHFAHDIAHLLLRVFYSFH